MFRVVQECLTNVHRHAESTKALIRIAREGDLVFLEVQDQGKGMSPDKLSQIQSHGSGVGIRGMRERVRHLKGVMDIQSNGTGATISVTLGTFYQKRFVPRTDLRTGTCLQFVGALAIVTPLALLAETLRFDATATLLAALAWSVLVISLAAIALLLLMLRRGEVSRVAALIYLVPPLTALEAFMLFGESLSVVQIVGMAVTALGVWLATHRR